MFTILTKEKKKELYGEGPWIYEPDHVTFTHAGRICHIYRHQDWGHLCGYVEILEDSPIKDIDVFDMPFSVHGGITFSDKLKFDDNENFAIGFDCAHANDLSPGLIIRGGMAFPDLFLIYKDIEYVTQEVKNLAEQVHKYETENIPGDETKSDIWPNTANAMQGLVSYRMYDYWPDEIGEEDN